MLGQALEREQVRALAQALAPVQGQEQVRAPAQVLALAQESAWGLARGLAAAQVPGRE